MQPTNVKVLRSPNLGDRVCSPFDYFREWKDAPRLHIDDALPSTDPLVFGGGGLLHGPWYCHLQVAFGRKGRHILWGVGTNQHDQTHPGYPEWLERFDLVGLRDEDAFNAVPGAVWVACPSCLHPAFDQRHPRPRREVVFYFHWERPPLDVSSGEPWLCNAQPAAAFPAVLAYLSGGQRVVTNTYHGAFWSLLLGRPVVMLDPFSSRHYSLGNRVAYASQRDWLKALRKAPLPPPDYLARCRASNHNFAERVATLLDTPRVSV